MDFREFLRESNDKIDFLKWLSEANAALKSTIGTKPIRIYRNTLKNVMPKGKIRHSLRVANTAAKMGLEKDTINAALFHDYLERGGTLASLELPTSTIRVIEFLSNQDKHDTSGTNSPLEHIKSMLPKLDEKTKNDVILIKLADRLDNLKKRHQNNGVSAKYAAKSKELAEYLFQNYSGDSKPILMVRDRFKKFGIKISKTNLRYN